MNFVDVKIYQDKVAKKARVMARGGTAKSAVLVATARSAVLVATARSAVLVAATAMSVVVSSTLIPIVIIASVTLTATFIQAIIMTTIV